MLTDHEPPPNPTQLDEMEGTVFEELLNEEREADLERWLGMVDLERDGGSRKRPGKGALLAKSTPKEIRAAIRRSSRIQANTTGIMRATPTASIIEPRRDWDAETLAGDPWAAIEPEFEGLDKWEDLDNDNAHVPTATAEDKVGIKEEPIDDDMNCGLERVYESVEVTEMSDSSASASTEVIRVDLSYRPKLASPKPSNEMADANENEASPVAIVGRPFMRMKTRSHIRLEENKSLEIGNIANSKVKDTPKFNDGFKVPLPPTKKHIDTPRPSVAPDVNTPFAEARKLHEATKLKAATDTCKTSAPSSSSATVCDNLATPFVSQIQTRAAAKKEDKPATFTSASVSVSIPSNVPASTPPSTHISATLRKRRDTPPPAPGSGNYYATTAIMWNSAEPLPALRYQTRAVAGTKRSEDAVERDTKIEAGGKAAKKIKSSEMP